MEWFPLGQVLPPTRYDRKEEGSRLSSFVFSTVPGMYYTEQ